MYYHTRPLRYVRYGRVEPPPGGVIDPDFAVAYDWLGEFCGFSPQVWLSRSRSAITGFRYLVTAHSGRARLLERHVLFGFEGIRGYPVHYDFWCELLTPLTSASTVAGAGRAVRAHLDWLVSDEDLRDDPAARIWSETRSLTQVLDRCLFVEHDQVVVPALNLKAAKTIVCGSEREKKALRKLGFIEDRVEIRPPR
ncbi:MAG: hypothetical protein ACC682_08650 [Gemmatimonadota bacterium]